MGRPIRSGVRSAGRHRRCELISRDKTTIEVHVVQLETGVPTAPAVQRFGVTSTGPLTRIDDRPVFP